MEYKEYKEYMQCEFQYITKEIIYCFGICGIYPIRLMC